MEQAAGGAAFGCGGASTSESNFAVSFTNSDSALASTAIQG
jgi:hypothetical protein